MQAAKQSLTALLFLTLALAGATAATYHFQSGTHRVSLLELYTSEGCNSCPPAEAWLNRLRHSPGLWTAFVPVAFHVDYWNNLGWTDRWSSPDFSQRERDYAQIWHSDTIYTPCFVLNGVEWHGWILRRDVPGPLRTEVGILAVESNDTNHWTATYVPSTSVKGRVQIHAAVLACDLDSDVKAGENKGRRLHHEFAALDVVQIGLADHDGIEHGKFIISLPKPETKTPLALAVWITWPGELIPLQATGGWLIPPASTEN